MSSYPFEHHYPIRDAFMDDIPFVAKTIRMISKKEEGNLLMMPMKLKPPSEINTKLINLNLRTLTDYEIPPFLKFYE